MRTGRKEREDNVDHTEYLMWYLYSSVSRRCIQDSGLSTLLAPKSITARARARARTRTEWSRSHPVPLHEIVPLPIASQMELLP